MVARILSRSSTIEESEDEESLLRRSEIEKKLNLRRIMTLLAIVLGILATASTLLFSVAYQIRRQSSPVEEIVCAANDVACIGKLCPKGMTWQPEENQCVDEGQARVGHLGPNLVDINRPAFCDVGFVWVSHKKQCMRSVRAG